MENIDLELIINATLKEIAVAIYREKKISLAKAESIAGVSMARMKDILREKSINPRLGVEGLTAVLQLRGRNVCCTVALKWKR